MVGKIVRIVMERAIALLRKNAHVSMLDVKSVIIRERSLLNTSALHVMAKVE